MNFSCAVSNSFIKTFASLTLSFMSSVILLITLVKRPLVSSRFFFDVLISSLVDVHFLSHPY